MAKGLFMKTDYANPVNRKLKVQVDGEIRGYKFSRISKWIEMWDDPVATIRNTSRYRQVYIENQTTLMEMGEDKESQVSFIVGGLNSCIDMLQKVQSMDKEDKYRKSFGWEAKCILFAFFDFCEPIQDNVSISDILTGRSQSYD